MIEPQDEFLEAVLEAFISQMYIERALPAGFISNIKMQHTESFKALEAQAGKALSWVVQPQGQRRQWLLMTEHNAKLAIARKAAQKSTTTIRLNALLEVLGMTQTDADASPVQPDNIRIECFDISHMAGEHTVASCVVYQNQAMQTKQYRRYTISDITPGDDYAAMRQAVLRRYQQASIDGEALPDVILIDGGVGQVSTVKSVLEDLGLPLHILVGVKKGDRRKVGLETLMFADGRESLALGETHPALMLIAEIRDEAHRFAISGMRTKRAKVQTASALDEIDGIGPVRKRKLLARFGGLPGVKKAGIQDLQSVDGISRTLAEEIYRRLHG